jgi:hypothetical protein
MVWECENVLGRGGEVFLNLLVMWWEMDLWCGFDMIYGVGRAFKDFFLRNYFVLHALRMCGWQIIYSSGKEVEIFMTRHVHD